MKRIGCVFERPYIHDSYACRKDKGSHRAVERAQAFARGNRYFLSLADSKDELHGVHGEVREFLRARLQLDLNENKWYVAPVSEGIPFLGMRVFPGTLRLSRQSPVRCRQKLKRRKQDYAEGRITQEKLIKSF